MNIQWKHNLATILSKKHKQNNFLQNNQTLSPSHPIYIYTNLQKLKCALSNPRWELFTRQNTFVVDSLWFGKLFAVRFLFISLHNTVKDIMRQEECKQCSQLIVIKFRLPCLLTDKCVEMRWTAQKLTGLSVKKANVGKTAEKYTKTSLLKHKPKKMKSQNTLLSFLPSKEKWTKPSECDFRWKKQ